MKFCLKEFFGVLTTSKSFHHYILKTIKNKVRILFLTFDNFTDSLVLRSVCTKC